MTSSSPTDAQGITFVLPLVHPQGGKVENYAVVEMILRETLTSLTAQHGPRPHVVVVCHQAPDWAGDFADHVTFLVIPEHPGFAAGRNHVQVDKGMKYVLGTWVALMEPAPDWIMLMDGDDFVHRDLLVHLQGQEVAEDGFLLAGGYHAALRPASTGFQLEAALKVNTFNDTCGSCRVFRASTLKDRIAAFQPALAALTPDQLADDQGVLDKGFVDLVVAATDPLREDQDGLIRVLGRHVRQKDHFNFIRVTEALVAKGCGHGNHDGPKAGEIHWHKVTAVTAPGQFLRDFGLAGRPTLQPRLKWQYQVMGSLQSLRRVAGRLKRAITG
ncbi:glycosyltransferase family A protein [uncultured Roseobacter sp.]|uniref:glycosyltransferase family A protein n=1 Tax=uncultured Roseobacter sp. TaxID=114847 RepID=UPI0026233DBB|nr:glycosyltransferase family A protein [uncultured Roseobacter sp.]